MYFTPGWGAVLAVGGTLGGVIATQAVNTLLVLSDRHEASQRERTTALLEVLELADEGAAQLEQQMAQVIPFIAHDRNYVPEVLTLVDFFAETSARSLRIEQAAIRAQIVDPSAKSTLVLMKEEYALYAAETRAYILNALAESTQAPQVRRTTPDDTSIMLARKRYGDARVEMDQLLRLPPRKRCWQRLTRAGGLP